MTVGRLLVAAAWRIRARGRVAQVALGVCAMALIAVAVATFGSGGSSDGLPMSADAARQRAVDPAATSLATPGRAAATPAAATDPRAHADQSGAGAERTLRSSFGPLVEKPGWSDLRADDSVEIERVGRGGHDAVVKTDGGRALVSSALPLSFAERSGGPRRALSTKLVERSGALAPQHALSDYRIAKQARGDGALISFPRADFAVREPAAGAARARLVSGKTMYANSGNDADLVVAPLPTGAQVMWQLRSSDSPTRLRLDFDGVDGVREKRPLGLELQRDGKRVGGVSAPIAFDAAGQPVDLRWAADGEGMRIDVDHREKNVRYPVLVDPFVNDDQRYWIANAGLDFTGWTYQQSGHNNVASAAGNGPFGRGLYLATAAGNQPYGAWGRWQFGARHVPGAYQGEGAHIHKADIGYTAAILSGSNAYRAEGILANTTASWEPTSRWRGPAVQNPYTAGPYVSFVNEPGYGYRVHCLATCTLNGDDGSTLGSPGNFSTFWLVTLGYSNTGSATFMGSSLIFQSEQYPPHISAPNAPAGWVDSATVTANATDYGLGIKGLSANAPGWGGSSIAAPACLNAQPSNFDTPGQAKQGDRNRRCPLNAALSFATAGLPEGSQTVTVTARDIVENVRNTPIPLKIDRTAPQISATAGSLADIDGGATSASSLRLDVTATDGQSGTPSAQRSGVKQIEIRINDEAGQRIKRSAQQGCPAGSCAMTASFELSEEDLGEDGPKTVSIVAVDQLGHASNPAANQIAFTLDTTAPVVYEDGDVFAAAGQPLTGTEYTVDGRARDLTLKNGAGSGILSFEVLVNGEVVASENVNGCTQEKCPDFASMSAPYTLQTADVGDGEHDVHLRVTDRAGNVGGAIDTADVMRAEPLAPITVTTPDSQAWSIEGGAPGDRAGAAVANVGDVNGDGLDDVLVGAPGADPLGRQNAGAAYLVLGAPTPSSVVLQDGADRVVRFAGAKAGDGAGVSVAAAGDVNGDGHMDLLVGAPGSAASLIRQGHVYVVFGGPAITDVDLGALGGAGLTIRGPAVTLDLGPSDTVTTFGEQVGTRKLGDFWVQGDVNGDDLDDVVIGAGNQSDLLDLRLNGGIVYVIFGQAQGGLVDAANLGSRGYRIKGAALQGGAGKSTAFLGDVNGDDLADIALTAPGIGLSNRASAGTAYVVFGKPSTATIDLASLGAGGYAIYGAPGDRITNVASSGDVDGDSNPDILLGGSGGVMVFGKADTAGVDLLADFAGYRMTPPADAGPAPAVVAGLADLDGDHGPDSFVGYPSAAGGNGAGYVVFGQSSTSNRDLQDLGGERGARIQGSPAARSASSADSLDSDVDEDVTVVTGEPSAGSSGAVRMVANATIFTGGETIRAGAVQTRATNEVRPQRSCQSRKLWSFPWKSDKRAVPRCRRAQKGTVDQPATSRNIVGSKFNPRPKCGAPTRTCKASIYRGGNARVQALALKTTKIVSIVDSFGDELWRIQQIEPAKPRCYAIIPAKALTTPGNDAPKAITCDKPNTRPAFEITGKACMSTSGQEGTHWLVRLARETNVDKDGKTKAQGENFSFEGTQGFIRRDDLDWPQSEEDKLTGAYTGCGQHPRGGLKGTPDPVEMKDRFILTGATQNDPAEDNELYVGQNNYSKCGQPTLHNRACGAALANYQGPDATVVVPQVAVEIATTGVAPGGGIVRAIAPRNTPERPSVSQWRRYDSIPYADPNVPCGQRRVATWEYGAANPNGPKENKMWGWIPRPVLGTDGTRGVPGSERVCP